MIVTSCLPYQFPAMLFSYKMVFDRSKEIVACIFWINLPTIIIEIISQNVLTVKSKCVWRGGRVWVEREKYALCYFLFLWEVCIWRNGRETTIISNSISFIKREALIQRLLLEHVCISYWGGWILPVPKAVKSSVFHSTILRIDLFILE